MHKNNTTGTWQALGLAFQLGYTIAIPAVIFALAGRVLDKKFNTSPLLLIIGLFVALTLSSISVFRKANQIMQDATKDNKKEGDEEREINSKQ